MLTLYRRHAERCPVHELKLTAAAKRRYMDCDCPLRIYGNTETTHVPRQSTGTNIIAAAEAQRQALLKNGQDQKVHGPRLDDCIERFSASRKEELGEKTDAAYRFQLDQLRAYCATRGVHFMRELSVDLLEDFKVEGLPDNMAATSKAQVTAKIRCFLRASEQRGFKRQKYTCLIVSSPGLTNVSGCRKTDHSGMARPLLVMGSRTRFTILCRASANAAVLMIAVRIDCAIPSPSALYCVTFPLVPQPGYLLNTSPDKWQAVWKVEGFDLEQAERLMCGPVREFGADPAAHRCPSSDAPARTV